MSFQKIYNTGVHVKDIDCLWQAYTVSFCTPSTGQNTISRTKFREGERQSTLDAMEYCVRANQYTCSWLVCWVLCSMLRRQGGEEERKSRRYNQSPVPVNKKLQSRSTWVNRKISIQAKFKKCHHPDLSVFKVSVSRSRYWFPIQSSGFLFVEKVSVCLGTLQISNVKGKVK